MKVLIVLRFLSLQISRIVTDERFGGISTYLMNDLAVLILDNLIVFSDLVHPACIDLSNVEFKNTQLVTNQTGKVKYMNIHLTIIIVNLRIIEPNI